MGVKGLLKELTSGNVEIEDQCVRHWRSSTAVERHVGQSVSTPAFLSTSVPASTTRRTTTGIYPLVVTIPSMMVGKEQERWKRTAV